jgi:hypothetical protein
MITETRGFWPNSWEGTYTCINKRLANISWLWQSFLSIWRHPFYFYIMAKRSFDV